MSEVDGTVDFRACGSDVCSVRCLVIRKYMMEAVSLLFGVLKCKVMAHDV